MKMHKLIHILKLFLLGFPIVLLITTILLLTPPKAILFLILVFFTIVLSIITGSGITEILHIIKEKINERQNKKDN
jgi:Mg2+/citrate symporter